MRLSVSVLYVLVIALLGVSVWQSAVLRQHGEWQYETEAWKFDTDMGRIQNFRHLHNRLELQEEVLRAQTAAMLSVHETEYEELLTQFLKELEDARKLRGQRGSYFHRID